MEGTVDIPGIGSTKKMYLIVGGVATLGLVGWYYYNNKTSAEAEVIDPGLTGPEELPVVPGAVGGSGVVGVPSETDASNGKITDNASWARFAADELESRNYDSKTVSEALGKFLSEQALTSAEQTIVQAAIAVAGYPPVGSIKIKPGGDTPISSAPASFRASGVFESSYMLSWNAVPGASGYAVYEGAAKVHTTSGTTQWHVTGKKPATSYGPYTVKAISVGGVEGPASAPITVKTSGTPPIRGGTPIVGRSPVGVGAIDIKRTEMTIGWDTMIGAAQYALYKNGVKTKTSRGTHIRVTGLRPNTSYKWTVYGYDSEGKRSKPSATITRKTAK